MTNHWLITTGIGAACFALGFFIKRPSAEVPVAQSSETSRSLVPGSSRSARPTFEPSDNISSLSTRLAEIDPSLVAKSFSSIEVTLFEDMFFKLAQEDVEKAAEFLRNNPDLDGWSAIGMEFTSEWSRKDPEAAYQWALENLELFPSDDRRDLTANILANYARKDPAKVASLLGEMEDQTTLEDISPSVARHWGLQDHQAAMKWLIEGGGQNLPDHVYTESYSEIMRGYLVKDPEEASYFIGQLETSPLKDRLLEDAGRVMATQDLGKAKSWIENLPDSVARKSGLAGILTSHALESPKATLDLLITNREVLIDDPDFVSRSFNDLVQTSPNLVKDRFDELPPSAQGPVAREIIFSLSGNDQGKEELSRFVQNLPKGEIFDQGADAIARARVHEAPSEAMQWAGQVEDQATRGELVLSLISGADDQNLGALADSLDGIELPAEVNSQVGAMIEERLNRNRPTLVVPE